jgi:hypothetical protein
MFSAVIELQINSGFTSQQQKLTNKDSIKLKAVSSIKYQDTPSVNQSMMEHVITYKPTGTAKQPAAAGSPPSN